MPAAPSLAAESREIRVFLSSTFRDFMQERDLLVKQVFPALRRMARERGVELVDVDLRWGITQEQSDQGHVIGICLAEIERCRPYFIGMLGERYGWTPGVDDYPAEVLEREPWLQQHRGDASVTELEILHGVLNDPEMAGRAFFYFRDPAWSEAQSEPGYVCETAQEAARLAELKQRIRSSGFPVVEALADPQVIAERIETDLWALIDRLFPEEDQPDALEREARKHADYRKARTGGQYIGGETYIAQLERWIEQGEQQILITGESGAGKSALIANWMERHSQSHPADVLYAHHLGCTNDASALRPLLGRLIDTASQQLLDAEVITEALAVPEDWWELLAKVAETLQTLGRWCQQQGRRWIWVLDGLDRLDPDDQNALPWLPQTPPDGVQVVASALACPAREILRERGYTTLTIEPLASTEQEQLIQRYLKRYTKELDGGLRQRILNHPLAGSPLFLKVLLEELRQCGRHDTLQHQLAFYLGSQTVDDLYERVLERLENDGSGGVVRKVMTALWASRAGLTVPELLVITDLKPLQWAPIDLALEKAFGRNGNRLVFDHDYLRIAVEDRYLPTEEARLQAHSGLADWYQEREGWDERDSEELPWQLQQAGRLDDLRDWLLKPWVLAKLQWDRGSRETINYWLLVKDQADGELDELIAKAVDIEIAERKDDVEDQIWFLDRIAALIDDAGLYRELLLRLRTLSLELEEATEGREEASMLNSLAFLASAHQDMGNLAEAEPLYLRCLEAKERLLGPEHPSTLTTVNNLAGLFQRKGDYEQAEAYYNRCLEARERLLGPEHPHTLTTVGNLGLLYSDKGDYEQAEAFYKRDLEASERLLGPEHPHTLTTVGNLGLLYSNKGDYEQAEAFYKRDLEASERLLGPEHPDTLTTVNNLAGLFRRKGDYEQAEAYYNRCLEARERLLGPEHPDTLTTVNGLAGLFQDKGDYEQAEAYYNRCWEASERLLGPEHPYTLTTVNDLAVLFQRKGDYEQAEAFYQRCLEAQERLLGPEHPHTLTTIDNLAVLFQDKGDYERAEAFYQRCLEARERQLGPEHPDTMLTMYHLADFLSAQQRPTEAIPLRRRELGWSRKYNGDTDSGTLMSINKLANDLHQTGELEEAETLLRELIAGRKQILEPDDFEIGQALGGLAKTLEAAGKFEEAVTYAQLALDHRLAHEGADAWWTNRERLDLARILHKLDRSAEALHLLTEIDRSMANLIDPDEDDRWLQAEAQDLRSTVRLACPPGS